MRDPWASYDDWKCTDPNDGIVEFDWDPDLLEDSCINCDHCDHLMINPDPIYGCVGWSKYEGATFEFKCVKCDLLTELTIQADHYV